MKAAFRRVTVSEDVYGYELRVPMKALATIKEMDGHVEHLTLHLRFPDIDDLDPVLAGAVLWSRPMKGPYEATKREYVVHYIDGDGNLTSGGYHEDLSDALLDFLQRTGRL